MDRSIGASSSDVTVVQAEGVSHVEVRALDANGNVSASTAPAGPHRPHRPAGARRHTGRRSHLRPERSGCWRTSAAPMRGGSDIDTCVGTASNGADIDTGTARFARPSRVTATDAAGQHADGHPQLHRGRRDAAEHHDRQPRRRTPSSNATTAVPSDYTCSDEVGGSGLATCVGTGRERRRRRPPPPSVTTTSRSTRRTTPGTSSRARTSYTVLDVTAPTDHADLAGGRSDVRARR